MSVQPEAASVRKTTVWPPPLFFPVSVTKLLVMSTATLGVYQLYWFWRNWDLVKSRERTRILPFMRALFPIFFVYALLERIYEEQPSSRQPVLLAVPWILLGIAWRLPGAWSFVAFAGVLFLVPAQRTANRRNARAAPEHDRNERFTAWNWVTVGVGGVLLVLAVIGMFLPPSMTGDAPAP
ncbi:MAG: hypothetical protein JSR36_08245 [Proteobacteria bacterium]|nr:hypothetical protein [Pseudomonadota bacterium]